MQAHGAILSIVALFLGFIQAPFYHIHPEDLDHPVSSAPAHVHVHHEHNSGGPAVDAHTADDDAIDLVWSVSAPPVVALQVDFAIAGAVVIPTLALSSTVVLIPQHRGHDPPDFASTPSRAPPA